MKNYIDDNFLNELFNTQEREIYARITALTFSEKVIDSIEGNVTGGSINIDGESSLRRTCSLTLVAQNVNINNFYWGLKNKFKLEIGLKNNIDKNNYPEIIWFKQGIYVITAFNTTQSINNYTINISGKDKMCLLNGDMAGTLPHTTDFGVEEYFDGEKTIYNPVPIKQILYQSLQSFGNELPHNIIINDIDDYGMDLLEYRGDIPIYLFKKQNSNEIVNMTLNENQRCWKKSNDTLLELSINEVRYESLTNLSDNLKDYDIIYLSESTDTPYSVIKLEYGMNAGYRSTPLIYAGDLIANIGEALTSVYDKIKNMLGEFEYFYDIDGHFIFQRKPSYINTPFNSLKNDNNQVYADAAINSRAQVFNLLNNKLIISFQNTPNLLNLKNDYCVWGKKKTVSGSELDIHMRYAIDIKPIKYYSLIDNKEYNSNDYDWRELIYKMALDYRRFYFTDEDFFSKIIEKNPQYPTGKTGYEQYYTDMEGFWRLLYDPNATSDEDFYLDGPNKYWNKEVILNPENLIFWFDFLDANNSDLAKYQVMAVGSRTKVINDNDIKKIYYREIPKVIFVSNINSINYKETGYTYLQLPQEMENLFTISSKGKSCKEKIDELLYIHACCTENVNVTTLPLYHLEPNIKILINDNNSKINGEYIINKLTIPLTYNGTMSITGFKSISSIM